MYTKTAPKSPYWQVIVAVWRYSVCDCSYFAKLVGLFGNNPLRKQKISRTTLFLYSVMYEVKF